MGQLEVRKAETDTQVREIADLAKVIWNEHFTPIIGKDQVDYMVEKFQSYPIFSGGEFCGYTGIHPGEDNRLFLSKLYLKKESRGHHLATGAFSFLKEICRERGYSAIWLTCNKHNDNSLGVYRHFGFEIIDTQEADIGGGFIMDDYIMEYKMS